jgi:hypothetical protein
MIEGRLFEARSDRGGDAYRAAERGFGLTFYAIGFVVGIAKVWHSQSLGWLWLAGAGVLLAAALIHPRILALSISSGGDWPSCCIAFSRR